MQRVQLFAPRPQPSGAVELLAPKRTLRGVLPPKTVTVLTFLAVRSIDRQPQEVKTVERFW